MSRFYIGQKVVCVKTATSNEGIDLTIKGNIYVIKNVFCCCGTLSLDLGIPLYAPFKRTMCNGCGANLADGTWLQLSHRFAPLSERSAESESFSETLIKEIETEINEENLILK